MSSNKQRLGDILTSQMKKTSAAAIPTTIELGTIGSNLSLKVDSLPVPIPKGEYMINLMLAGSSYRTSSETHSHSGADHSHSGGAHSHTLPGLQSGNRVMVAWCGKEPVVLAVLVSS